MRQVIQWAAEALAAFMAKRRAEFEALLAEGIWGQPPLAIEEAGSATTGLKSFKPPWTAAQCLASMASTGMYEASGNVVWVKPFPETEMDSILRAPADDGAGAADVAGELRAAREAGEVRLEGPTGASLALPDGVVRLPEGRGVPVGDDLS